MRLQNDGHIVLVRFELKQYWALSIELQEHNNPSDLWTQAAWFLDF